MHEQLRGGALAQGTLTRADEKGENHGEREKAIDMRQGEKTHREPYRSEQHDVACSVAVEQIAEDWSEKRPDDVDARECQRHLGAGNVEGGDLLGREHVSRMHVDAGRHENEEPAQRNETGAVAPAAWIRPSHAREGHGGRTFCKSSPDSA